MKVAVIGAGAMGSGMLLRRSISAISSRSLLTAVLTRSRRVLTSW